MRRSTCSWMVSFMQLGVGHGSLGSSSSMLQDMRRGAKLLPQQWRQWWQSQKKQGCCTCWQPSDSHSSITSSKNTAAKTPPAAAAPAAPAARGNIDAAVLHVASEKGPHLSLNHRDKDLMDSTERHRPLVAQPAAEAGTAGAEIFGNASNKVQGGQRQPWQSSCRTAAAEVAPNGGAAAAEDEKGSFRASERGLRGCLVLPQLKQQEQLLAGGPTCAACAMGSRWIRWLQRSPLQWLLKGSDPGISSSPPSWAVPAKVQLASGQNLSVLLRRVAAANHCPVPCLLPLTKSLQGMLQLRWRCCHRNYGSCTYFNSCSCHSWRCHDWQLEALQDSSSAQSWPRTSVMLRCCRCSAPSSEACLLGARAPRPLLALALTLAAGGQVAVLQEQPAVGIQCGNALYYGTASRSPADGHQAVSTTPQAHRRLTTSCIVVTQKHVLMA